MPDFPNLPPVAYDHLEVEQRQAILRNQLAQFESEMFGHQANYARFKAQYDSAASETEKASYVRAADEAVSAIKTLQGAIATTQAELTALDA